MINVPSSVGTLALIRKIFRSYFRHIALMGGIGIVGSVVAGIGASAVVPLLSFVVGDASMDQSRVVQWIVAAFSFVHLPYTVTSLLVVISCLFLFKGFSLFLFSYIRMRVIYDYRTKTMAQILEQILQSRWTFLLKQKIGHVQNILVQDVDKSSSLLGSIAHTMLSGVSAVIFIAFAFALSVQVSLITVVVSGAFLFLFRPLLKKMKSLRSEYSVESKNLFQYLVEHLAGIKSVKIAAVENEVFKRGLVLFTRWRDLELKGNILRSLNKQSIEPASILLVASIFAFSYHTPGFNLQTFVATIYLIQQVFRHLELVQGALQDIQESIPHAEHVLNFEEAVRSAHEKSDVGIPFSFHELFSFEGVSFFYTMDAPVLAGLTFRIKRGEMLGIIGPSGSGKSTIADVMTRLLVPQKGRVLLDGIDAEAYNLFDWRSHVGYVSQDIFLLNDTVENNIKFYGTGVSDEEMVVASKDAHIYDFIKSLPGGFKTIVGDRGVMLSGGQRQRIVLARVLARRPAILILDEATSALDNESEVLIQKAIRMLKGKITVCAIAHRLSTLVDADRVLVLDRGKIIEEDTPQHLLQDHSSYFYKMYHMKEV